MPIQGSIEEAGLPDVLQLLSLGKKTGCLSMVDGTMRGEIYLDAGRISYATIANRLDRLGDVLVKVGRITQEHLKEATDEQARGNKRQIGRILVDSGRIDRDDLERFVRLQVEEAVHFLFTWKQGTFTFTSDRRPPHEPLPVALDSQGLLLEGARRVDEWSLILKKIPSFDLVYQRCKEKLSGAAAEDLTYPQQRILPLLDGTRDVAGIVEITGLNEFDVGKALYGLVMAGFARLVERRTQVRHLDYRELLAYVVREAEFADPQRRKDAGRHIVDCPTCADRLRKIQVRQTEGSGMVAIAAVEPQAPAETAADAGQPQPAAPVAPDAAGPLGFVDRRARGSRTDGDRHPVERRGGRDRRRAANAAWPQSNLERRIGPRREEDRQTGNARDIWSGDVDRRVGEMELPAPALRSAGPGARATEPRQISPLGLPGEGWPHPAAEPAADDETPVEIAPVEVFKPAAKAAAPAPAKQASPPASGPTGASKPAVKAAALAPAKQAPPPASGPTGAPTPAAKAAAPAPAKQASPPASGPTGASKPAAKAAAPAPAKQASPPASGPTGASKPAVKAAALAPAKQASPPASGPTGAPTPAAKAAAPAPAPAKQAPPPASEQTDASSGEIVWLTSPEESLQIIRASRSQLRAIDAAAPAPASTTPVPAASPVAPRPAESVTRAGEAVGRRPLPLRRLAVAAVIAGVALLGFVAGKLGKSGRSSQAAQTTAAVTLPPPAAAQPSPKPQTPAAEPPATSPPAPAPSVPVATAPAAPITTAPAAPAQQRAPPQPAAVTRVEPSHPAAEPRPVVQERVQRAAPSPVTATAQPPAAPIAAPRVETPPAPPAPTVGIIRGVVHDASGRALGGARVSVRGTTLSAVADASGAFEIHNVSEGSVSVQATAEGYVAGSTEVRARGGATVAADLSLSRAPTAAAAEADKDLSAGGWAPVSRAEAATTLGGTLGAIEGLSIESIAKSTAGSRQRVRVAQITQAGERVVLTETLAGAAVRGTGPAIVTALRVMPPSEAYPFSTGTVSFGNILITVKSSLAPDVIHSLLEKLAEVRQ